MKLQLGLSLSSVDNRRLQSPSLNDKFDTTFDLSKRIFITQFNSYLHNYLHFICLVFVLIEVESGSPLYTLNTYCSGLD